MKRKARRIAYKEARILSARSGSAKIADDGYGTNIPPSLATVEIYFCQKGFPEMAAEFHEEQTIKKWKTNSGRSIRNWKVLAAEWIYNYRLELGQQFRKSPFYSGSFY